MYLTPEQWLGCAAQARNAAQHLPFQAGELAAYAEECDLAAALTAFGHFPVVEPPVRVVQCSEGKRVLALIDGGGAGRRSRSTAAAFRAPALRVVE